jgi:hypothetical protein
MLCDKRCIKVRLGRAMSWADPPLHFPRKCKTPLFRCGICLCAFPVSGCVHAGSGSGNYEETLSVIAWGWLAHLRGGSTQSVDRLFANSVSVRRETYDTRHEEEKFLAPELTSQFYPLDRVIAWSKWALSRYVWDS